MISQIRLIAQKIRHTTSLSRFDGLWNLLRPWYLGFLNHFAQKRGLWVTVGGHKFRIHPKFANIGWEKVEVEAYRVFSKRIKHDSVLYDIGAHIGTYTMIALRLMSTSGRVVCYEPDNYTRQMLTQHLRWNNCQDRTIVRSLCCGAKSGKKDFYWKPHQYDGMNSLYPVPGFEKTKVNVATLDQEVFQLNFIPTIIKIDVEGAEWDVLKGGVNTISQYKPLLFLSLHPRILSQSAVTPKMILDWLIDRGYEYKIIDESHELHVFASPRNTSEVIR